MNIKKKLLWLSEVKLFNEKREYHRDNLIWYKKLIAEDDVLDIQLISNITEEIHHFADFRNILTREDKMRTRMILKQLHKDIYGFKKVDYVINYHIL